MIDLGLDSFLIGFIDLGLSAPLRVFLRGAAAVGGFIAGWFAAGPIVRLLVRAAFHKPVHPDLMPWCKLGGAALAAFLIFYYLPLGTDGGGGPGVGPGTGGPGDGKGPAANSGDPGKKAGNGDSVGGAKGPEHPQREILAVELLGGDRYKDDLRFYLLHRKEPAVTIEEVDKLFQEKKGRLLVEIVLRPDSVGEGTIAFNKLQNSAKKHEQFTRVKRVKKELADSKAPSNQGP